MEIKEIKDKNIWEEFVSLSSYAYFNQSWQWGEFERKGLGKKIFRIGFWDREKLVAVCLCVEEISRFGKFIYCPRGPILRWEDRGIRESVVRLLIDYFRSKKYFCLRVDPAILKTKDDIINTFYNLGFRDAVNFIQAERVWILDIEGKSEEELMQGMRKKARYTLKQAMKKDFDVGISSNLEEFKTFVDILDDISIKKNFPTVSKDYLIQQFKILGDFFRFFYAKYQDEIVAGGFFSFYGNESAYLRGAMSDNPSSSEASYLVQWEAIKYAQELGMKRHNFWGVAEDKNYHPGYPAFGYSKFKKGFGGYVEEYMRTKDFVYNMVKYRMLRLNEGYRKIKYRGCN